MATPIPGRLPVPINLSTFRFILNGEPVMAVDIPSDTLKQDVPGSTNKMFSFTLDPNLWYQVEHKVMHDGGILVTTTFAPKTGVIDESPNLPRNQYTGMYDDYQVYLVPKQP